MRYVIYKIWLLYGMHNGNTVVESSHSTLEGGYIMKQHTLRNKVTCHRLRAFAKKKFKKSEITMEVDGSRSYSDFVCFGKSSQNIPKPVLIFWSSISCVFCLHIYTLLKVVSYYDLNVCPCQWWVSKKSLDGLWALFQVYFGFLEFFNFAKPLNIDVFYVQVFPSL